jgi:hypothetical protein
VGDETKRRKQLDDAIEGRTKAKKKAPKKETEEQKRARESQERVEAMLEKARKRQSTDNQN